MKDENNKSGRHLLPLVENTPIFVLLEGDVSPRLQERFASLFRSVWDRIPQKDRTWILTEAGHHEGGLQVSLSLNTCERTNAWTRQDQGVIWFDAWFVDAATDRQVKAVIAHELGHVRGYADPRWPDHSEAVACLYAERIWGFHEGDPIFKSQVCLRLDEVVRQVGLQAQVFQLRTHLDGKTTDTYLLLRRGQKLDFDPDLTLNRLGDSEDDFEAIAAEIRNSYQGHHSTEGAQVKE